ncbi:ATP-binding protein [Vibrio profundum]|uniref:ATP-binding protein n=1 Tax=Vibrio profundum TaxID=2910247 RepID=UPI003D0CB89B
MKTKSLLSRLFFVFVVAFLFTSLLIYVSFESYNKKIALQWSVEFAKQNAEQHLVLRKYYAEKITDVVKNNSDIPVSWSVDRDQKKTIPLPSTFMHEISEETGQDKSLIHMNFYSKYPFEERQHRVLDSFQNKAVSKVGLDDDIYYEVGPNVIRVAIPDFMSSKTCVNCHNSLPDSPKKDWKVNDVAGIFETKLPIKNQYQMMRSESYKVFSMIALGFALLFLFSMLWLKRFVVSPIQRVEEELLILPEQNEARHIYIDGAEEFVNLSSNITNVANQLIARANRCKKAELEVRKVNEELESLVKERTMDLQGKIVQLEDAKKQIIESESMAALGTMVAGISHEINTPVGIALTSQSYILTSVEIMSQKFNAGELTERELLDFSTDLKEGMQLSISNLEHAAKLIQNFKKISADQMIEDISEFSLNELVSSCIFLLSHDLQRKGIKVNFSQDDNVDLSVKSCSGLLSQVMINLIKNAEIHAFQKVETPEISINAVKMDQFAEIVVRDNGVGIPKSDITKVFQPFFTTKRGNGGTGLGLSLAHNIVVHRLKGKVDIISKVGEFCEVKILIPIGQ